MPQTKFMTATVATEHLMNLSEGRENRPASERGGRETGFTELLWRLAAQMSFRMLCSRGYIASERGECSGAPARPRGDEVNWRSVKTVPWVSAAPKMHTVGCFYVRTIPLNACSDAI